MYARVKHDWQYDYNRFLIFTRSVMPETVPVQNTPRGTGKGANIIYSSKWYTFLKALNNGDPWITNTGTMLFNSTGNPKAAVSITNGGNVVKFTELTATHARIETINTLEEPVKYTGVTYKTAPWLIWKVVCIVKGKQEIVNPASGKNLYFPALFALNAWLPLSKLEIFPKFGPVTILADTLNIRATPEIGQNVIGQYRYGDVVEVMDYAPRGSDVWGWTGKGWICLQLNRSFFTTWHMETVPPLI